MTETDHHSQMRSVSRGDGSPGRPSGRPMRQLEFHQAMSDFCHMFPETDEEVIEAVLRANNGMVDATIDQLLTMNIDTEINAGDDDDLPDHILMSVERDVQQQQQLQPQQPHQGSRRLGREARATRKVCSTDSPEQQQSKDMEDCPPSYTEAVQSHLTNHHRSSNSRSRHRNSPTSNGNGGHHPRHSVGTMQHLLDLGPDTTQNPGNGSPTSVGSAGTVSKPSHHSHHHTSHHHHNNHHHQRSSNHHRHRTDTADGSPGKSRPGRNILAPATLPAPAHQEFIAEEFSFRPQRKGSLDSSEVSVEAGGGCHSEKSSHRWRSSNRESTNIKRPVYKNWNPPLLGTLPDDFLRLTKTPTTPARPSRHTSQLQRTMSAVGPERPAFYPTASSPSNLPTIDSGSSLATSQHIKQRPSSQKPHRSLSFAGHTNQLKRPPQNAQQSGLPQHEFSSDILQERMKENERRRRMASMDIDPDLAQYLEDERLAIILQNSEFLEELRGDRMFMMTLERDQKSPDNEKPKQEPKPNPVSSASLDGDDRDFIEGYGDDRHETLEAFPFSQQLPPPANEDVELRQKLRNMGKASRKQFAALARKFFLKRKKKSAQQILKESQAPSMMNLLDEDEDEDVDDDEVNSGDRNARSESYGCSNSSQ
ncbi:unnamed protein product, partial [Candidula unifasciata]